jgi:hypothetical protein
MNEGQNQLIELISCAIRGEKADELASDMQYTSIINMAEEHCITPLLFFSLHNSDIEKKIDIEELNLLKKRSILSSIFQIQHANQIRRLFTLFYSSNIQAIALKGMVLRELYPKPEFRLMSDCDILIKPIDLEKASEILIKEGYYQISYTKEHLTFKHDKHFLIDLHWTLEDKRGYSTITKFETKAWENAMYMQCGNTPLLSLSWEDMLVYLCMHMAGHTVSGGFGIRQLCDVVLLIEKKADEINWRSFIVKIKDIGIDKFTFAILQVCKEIFKLKIPGEISEYLRIERRYLEMFIDYILNGGVYGKQDLVNAHTNRIVFRVFTEDSNNLSDSFGVTKQLRLMFFPRIDNLKNRYPYAQKCSAFIPVAWASHIVNSMVNDNTSLFHKLRSFLSILNISRRKYKLLKYLEL